MAMGKTAHCTASEVAMHSKSLEISPSKSSASSPIHKGGSKAAAKGSTKQKFSKAHHKKGH